MTAPAAVLATPRRSRRRVNSGDSQAFGSLIPEKNPAANVAYQSALWGMLPVVGLVLGPLALISGAIASLNYRRDPGIEGVGHIRAAYVLGGLTCLTNFTGSLLIAYGMGWLGA